VGGLLAKQRVTYEQVLQKLELPVDIDKVKVCKFCNQYLHLIKVNRLIAFWVHKGEDVEKCAEKNPLYPGCPMVAQNMSLYKTLVEIWKGMMERKNQVDSENKRV